MGTRNGIGRFLTKKVIKFITLLVAVCVATFVLFGIIADRSGYSLCWCKHQSGCGTKSINCGALGAEQAPC